VPPAENPHGVPAQPIVSDISEYEKGEKMKRNICLLTGGLDLLLASSINAKADTSPLTECGEVLSGVGNPAFISADSGPGGSASISGGVGTITCNGFKVPTGFALTQVTVETLDNASGVIDPVNWTWTYSGEPLTPTPAATNSEDSSSTLSCSGTLQCNGFSNFSTINPYSGGQTTGAFSFIVTPGGNLTGQDNAEVSIDFTYVPTSTPPPATPEPGSLMLLWTGLVAMGAGLRRKLLGR